ncbi:hypothetical protein ACFLU6_13540, partial [Acidobacteriota bacterium]
MRLRSLRCVLSVCVFMICLAGPSSAQDALDGSLARVGLKRADLGWSPRGNWTRFPADIPYKLRHFDAILSEPLA